MNRMERNVDERIMWSLIMQLRDPITMAQALDSNDWRMMRAGAVKALCGGDRISMSEFMRSRVSAP